MNSSTNRLKLWHQVEKLSPTEINQVSGKQEIISNDKEMSHQETEEFMKKLEQNYGTKRNKHLFSNSNHSKFRTVYNGFNVLWNNGVRIYKD